MTKALATKKDKIEVRAITKSEIDFLIEVLQLKNKNEKKNLNKYYHFRKKYSVSETNPPQLLYKEEDDDGVAKVLLNFLFFSYIYSFFSYAQDVVPLFNIV